jgi:uncharacterized protein (TIGR02001 family)
MKRMIFAVVISGVFGPAIAADMPVKAMAPPPAFDRWDVAFGSSVASDYVFRGITQSNHMPSVSAYFEPRFNATKDLQLYAGVASESISFPNRAAAEVDIYGGIRPTFGKFTLDIGGWGYLYPGGQCFNALADPASGLPGSGADCAANGNLTNGLAVPVGFGNIIKRKSDYFEFFSKGNVDLSEQWNIGVTNYYSPNFLNLGGWGDYASVTGKWTAPPEMFGHWGIGMFVSGEFGRQWLGTSDAFYGNGLIVPSYAAGVPLPSYNTWNLGVSFTYKVFTLDLRYTDTNLSKGNCNSFTNDHATSNASPAFITPINPGTGATALGSNWCSASGIVKLSADLTALTSLK